MALTLEAVAALAPDDASAKAAKGLTSAAKWPTLGANDQAVWGECQGSGSKPYQTQVDLSGPAFKCSCPSRKFPCKHGLALLMLQAQSPTLFTATEVPAWVAEWVASRSEKAQKKEERQAEKAAAPVDEQAQARREAQRWQRIENAAEELQRWLGDQMRQGLGALTNEVLQTWHTMAARMVDAQAPGLAQRVRAATQGVRQGEDWPERTLHRLGLLQLACEALQRRSSLSPEMQAEVRAVAGWLLDKAEVLASGEQVEDAWTVLGCAQEERDDKLIERRVWLHGHRTGRRAWLWDHAFGGKGFEQAWIPGTCANATLAYFPGTTGLRAQPVNVHGAPTEPRWPQSTAADEWGAMARRAAASPWVGWHPLVLPDAVLQPLGAQPGLRCADRWLPLQMPGDDLWVLNAVSGGNPITVAGEWDGQTFAPLTAWHPHPPQPSAAPAWQRSQA